METISELKRENYDKKNPSHYVVSREEFEELKKQNDEDVEGLDYEEFCEVERESWTDHVRMVFRKPFEALDSIPQQQFWRNGVKPVKEAEVSKNLPSMVEHAIMVDVSRDESDALQ
jgi:hypothetical protein